nr:uncharacterized protein LOC110782573 [Spinacia oleracea]
MIVEDSAFESSASSYSSQRSDASDYEQRRKKKKKGKAKIEETDDEVDETDEDDDDDISEEEEVDIRKRRKKGKGMKEKVKRKRQKVVKRKSTSKMTNGESVRSIGLVVSTQLEMCPKAPNIVCRVEAFVKVLSKLDNSRKEEVMKMGFGGLLEFKMRWVDRKFCYWLLTRLGDDGDVEFGDGHVFKFKPLDFSHIFGLPFGGKKVPGEVDYEDVGMVRDIQEILNLYGVNLDDLKHATFLLSKVVKALASGCGQPLSSAQDRKEFRTLFLIIV